MTHRIVRAPGETTDQRDLALETRIWGPEYISRLASVESANLLAIWSGNDYVGSLCRSHGPRFNWAVNGGFETAGGGGADIWATWVETAGDGALADEGVLVHSGAHAAKLTAGATANTQVRQTLTVRPGQTMELVLWARGDGAAQGRYRVRDLTAAADIIAPTPTGVVGAAYVEVSAGFVVPAGCVSIGIDLMCAVGAGGICYFDDVAVWARLDGTHVGVTLGQPGIGDGRTCPFYDGATDYTNIYSAALAAAFNGAEGTALIWAKVADAGVWTDGVARRLVNLEVNGSNYMILHKPSNNTLQAIYRAGAVSKSVSVGSLGARLGFISLGMTVSAAADEARVFIDGAQTGSTQTGLGAWAGTLFSWATVIGAANATPTLGWHGWLGHAALWSKALTPAQVAALSVV